MPEEIKNETKPTFKKIGALVDGWLNLHRGETFDLDLICRQLQIQERDNRQLVAIKLAYEVDHQRLEKLNRSYTTIDKTLELIDWVNASDQGTLPIKWPWGHEDNSQFGFDGHVIVNPGDIIVVAGVSNMGKTAFCLNLLWENMDSFPCLLMGNEYAPVKFKRRAKRMDWANPLKEDGTPKFTLVKRRDGWKNIIEPDYINIIDWINLGDNFYQIGTIIEGIQAKLKGGIAVISLQKSEGKNLGTGGHFSEDLSSLYLLVDFERLTVRKCKEWFEHNPNGETYGFKIVDGGAKFHNIRSVVKCKKCWGSGNTKAGKCEECFGSGYTDA